MRGTWLNIIVLFVLVCALALAGCAKKAAKAPASGGVRRVHGVVLPAWAPKNPSPEFLRAAKVLKPLPDDLPTLPGPVRQVMRRGYAAVMPAVYELFGSLSDEQMQKLIASREVRIPITEMTPLQRKAVDTYIERRRGVARDLGHDDLLVDLYKGGAAQDLSNVKVGFFLHTHMVELIFWVKGPAGDTGVVVSTVAFM
jgi:hypothetical protein